MNTLILGAAGGIGSKLVQDLMGTSNLLLGYYNSSLNVPVESDKVDATDFDSVESFIKKGLDKFDTIDAVVCLPGSLILKPAHKCSEEEFYQTIDTNLKTSFSVTRAAGEHLKDSANNTFIGSRTYGSGTWKRSFGLVTNGFNEHRWYCNCSIRIGIFSGSAITIHWSCRNIGGKSVVESMCIYSLPPIFG